MTEILQKRGVRVPKEAKGSIYLLEDEDAFGQVGYKVMLSHELDCLLPAAKLKHNGQMEFIYLTKGCKTFQGIMAAQPRESVFPLCVSIIDAVLKVKSHGFLRCENLDLSPERIYFDPKTYEPRLIYLPLSAGEDENTEAHLEGILRRLLLQYIELSRVDPSPEQRRIVEALNNGTVGGLEGLEAVFGRARSEGGFPQTSEKTLRLVSLSPNMAMTSELKGSQMKIGRRKTNDLVLDFTTQISREHCTILRDKGGFLVQDDGSNYGTMVNNMRLTPQKPVPLKNGDTLTLPKISFKVEIV